MFRISGPGYVERLLRAFANPVMMPTSSPSSGRWHPCC